MNIIFFPNLIRFLITFIFLTLIGFGIYDYLQNIDSNDCSMTYMRSPIYVPIKLGGGNDKKYSNYHLFHQCEKEECNLNDKVKFTKAGSIPVLFITGNADSHKQVRSIAALSLSKSEQDKYRNENINFNFFTISFNEELSALYGPVLVKQTTYVQLCIKRILSLYTSVTSESKKPKSVILVGNSMGGIISRGVFILNTDTFNASNYVHTIITQASPHRHAIVNSDRVMSKFYSDLNSFWFNNETKSLDNSLLVSLYGGNRDILVRNNLANVNQQSSARVISQLTSTIPYVWRSIDHRCMAWCKEFVLVLNRALFRLVDKETRQVIEDREERARVFSHYLINDNFELTSEHKAKNARKYKQDSIKFVNNIDEINLSFNDFNNKEIVYVFEIDKLRNGFRTKNVESLFIYTNMAKFNTFLACKQFHLMNDNSYECADSLDLYTSYGSSIPPNELGRELGLKVLNMENIVSNFPYFLVRIPIWRKSATNVYRAILNLDWYNKTRRSETIDVPSLMSFSHSRSIELNDGDISYKQYILNGFSNLGQSFKFNSLPNDCQQILNNNKVTKLLSSNLQIKFNENKQVFSYSQITNVKNSNLTLKLSKNRHNLPVLHVYIFKLEHLLSDKSIAQCSTKYNFQLEISYISILGQLIRFYSLLLPSFLVLLIQFIDYLIINEPNLNSKWLILSLYLAKFKKLTFHMVCLSVLVLLNVNFFNIGTDFEYLQSIDEFIPMIIPILYISSYVIVSISIGLYFTIIFSILRKLFSTLFQFIYRQLNKFNQVSAFNCFVIIASGLYLPILSHIYVFYIEFISLIASNKITNKSFTRLLLLYILVLVKMPALLVWIKDLNSLNFEFNDLIAMAYENNFLDFELVLINFLIYLLNWFNNFNLSQQFVFVLKNLIFLNSCLTLLFSSLNLYRLPYFLFIHLFLMSFWRADDTGDKKEKDKKE